MSKKTKLSLDLTRVFTLILFDIDEMNPQYKTNLLIY